MHVGLVLLVVVSLVEAWPAKINRNGLSAFARERIEKLTGADGEARKARYHRLSRKSLESNPNNEDQQNLDSIERTLKKVKHESNSDDSIIGINEQSGLSEYLFEGDIDLSDAQLSSLEAAENGRNKRQITTEFNKWTGNKVYYEFDTNLTTRVQTSVIDSLKFLQENTCLTFIRSSTATNRIKIYMGAGCSSYVGMRGGVQEMSLSGGCSMRGVVVHEFFHALGIWHMQMRTDRDTYLRLDLSDIEPYTFNNFYKLTNSESVQLTPYEYGSVMHYAAQAYSQTGKLTLIPKDTAYLHTLGSQHISITDLEMVNKHYACDANCPAATSAQCKNKGFPNPNNCAKCVCPFGYGGDLCDQRPNDSCGATLTATDTWQTATKQIGQDDKSGPIDIYNLCTFWITTDSGYAIEVKVTELTNPQCRYGCPFNGIELKVRNEIVTNPRICCDEYLNEVHTSTLKPTPVILYNNYYLTNATFQYRRIPSAVRTITQPANAEPTPTQPTTTTPTTTKPTTTPSTTTKPTTKPTTTTSTTTKPTTTPSTSTKPTTTITTTAGPVRECTDRAGTAACATQKANGYCTGSQTFRGKKYNCAVTCGLCGKKDTPCKDYNTQCAMYLSTNLCNTQNPMVAEYNCAETCGFCKKPV